MSQYNNQGYLFPNHGRQGEGSPHYTGKVTIGGIEYRLSAWKKPKGESEMLSISVKTQEEYESEKANRKKMPKQSDYDYQGPSELQEQNVQGGSIDEIPF